MKPILVFCIVFELICLSAFTCTAAVILVPTDQPTIQAGIDAAVDGDTVLVADGTYTGEGNWDIDFKGKAITVTSENGPEFCMIEHEKGIGKHRGFFFHSFETRSSVLKGFTIKNCSHSAGGGILITNASPSIIQCVIDGNNAVHGGGLYIEHSNTALVQCSVIKNRVDGYWDGRGGAMIIENSDIEIDQCIIRDNRSIGYDNFVGGIYCTQSNLLIDKSLIIHNTSSAGRNNGGGFSISCSNVTVINSVIAKSSSSLNWGIVNISNVTLINSVVADNWSYHGFSINKSHITLINSIVWGNSSNPEPHTSSTFDIRYSNIQGGWDGIG
ncbi:MAG: right-handed parallel beta-helix repeat-containing protein, partial [bacterium]